MKMSLTFAVTAVLVLALVTSAQSGTITKTAMTPAATPTRLPVKPSPTTAAQTKELVHTSAGTSESRANPSTGAVNVASMNAATPKPEAMTEGLATLKQKFKTIAVKCQEELHAPNDIIVLVTNRTLVPQNEQQRCFMECVYKALNLVKNNKFNGDQARKLAQMRFADQPKEHKKVVTIIETCEKEAIVDPNTAEKCAAGRVIRNCFVKNILKAI